MSWLGFIAPGLEFAAEMNDSGSMRTQTTRRLRTRDELLALEDKYFTGTLGNLLSLGAAHFRQTNKKNRIRSRRNGALLRRRTAIIK